jgi:hypothetical protein
MSACIDTPVSWLRLEQLALSELDPGAARDVEAHLEACPACRLARGTLVGSTVQPLPFRAKAVPRRRRLTGRASLPWLSVALAAACLLLLARREAPTVPGPRIALKGGGELIVGVVRSRGGNIDSDPLSFRTGDLLKVTVTCSIPGQVTMEVFVVQGAETARPLGDTVTVSCGNQTILPGAMEVSGTDAITICVRPRAHGEATDPTGCVSLVAESERDP